MKDTVEIKWYEGRKRVKDFIVIVRDGKIQRFKKFPKENGELSGYILPRRITDIEDAGIDQCSDCSDHFPDGLNPCEHCDELFCCDCSDSHREQIADEFSTGGCNY